MRIVLPYPAPVLWPNGRTRDYRHRARLVKQHLEWAFRAALEARDRRAWTAPVEVRLTVHPKPRGPAPDRDNCAAACKAYLDGIAQAIGVNDRAFAAPIVGFGQRHADGLFVLELA